jgi:hypothetical protein
VDPLAAARGRPLAGVEDGGRSLAGGHGARSIDCLVARKTRSGVMEELWIDGIYADMVMTTSLQISKHRPGFNLEKELDWR